MTSNLDAYQRQEIAMPNVRPRLLSFYLRSESKTYSPIADLSRSRQQNYTSRFIHYGRYSFGFEVSAKRLIPTHTANLFGIIKIRTQNWRCPLISTIPQACVLPRLKHKPLQPADSEKR